MIATSEMVQHPTSAVAEYECALLAERFRRGKLQKARAGQYQAAKPPHGYRACAS